jgi:hypothetical protein
MKIQYVTTNAKKDAGNYPHCIDEQGKQIWDLTEYINNKNPNAPKAPVQVKEPSADDKVASMQGRLNPELPSGIAQSILNAKTQAELKAIWEANTDLHKVKKFTDAITQMKADLLKQGDK